MELKSAVTARLVLVGNCPGNCDGKKGCASAITVEGLLDPLPDGFVGVAQVFVAEEVFLGVGDAAAKSVLLLSVSVQPPPARMSAVVVLGAGAFAPPSLQLAVEPYPTKSTIDALAGQAPDEAVVVLMSATFPAVALIAIVPVASAVGRLFTPLPKRFGDQIVLTRL